MFEETEHDFGTVARSAKAEYEFRLSNLYLEDVHIASVRSSCGCTSPRIKTPLLKTYEKGAIVATLNTRSFYGKKGATITVTLDKPFYAEVQLHVRSYIRSDVVFHPGCVQLGSVDRGSPADTRVTVDYAGRSNWKILEVTSSDPHVSGHVVETNRNQGRVQYDLRVHLDENAPVGYVNNPLTLITNDQRAKHIPVPVEGRVTSEITVSPTSLFIGVMEPGTQVTRQLLVKGKKPFRILSVSCDAASFKVDASIPQEAKRVHLLPLTFTAGGSTGRVAERIRIETDLDGTTAELAAYAVVSSR
ncbi:MAG: hypothetical protein A2V70_10730 [Planctomycetes bacterium RBG_13_63_9]|nr:MAG: hypothetical protein A2V70_10730 [Planctomycetes bacterium RBG_13_63_9]